MSELLIYKFPESDDEGFYEEKPSSIDENYIYNSMKWSECMGFPTSVADEVLVRCGRHCCLCGKFVGQKIELHHIKQVADGGEDTVDNCIPLCFDCHAEVKAYNSHHPKGRKFTEKELKGHRDKCYERYSLKNEKVDDSELNSKKMKRIFPPHENMSLIRWGYPEQEKLCPIFPGNMVLIAGCTGSKKSTYLHHIVNQNIIAGRRVAYCCMKDKPFDVSIEIIGENVHVNAEYIKRGIITEEDWGKLTGSPSSLDGENLALIPYSEVSDSNKILELIANSEAEIVVIDDFNGISLDGTDSIEQFFYKLKNIAAQSQTVIFVIYNLSIPNRLDKRPMLRDFPTDNYYRLFDIVQFLYKPDLFYNDEEEKERLEVIIVKGALKVPYIINLFAPDKITGIFSLTK